MVAPLAGETNTGAAVGGGVETVNFHTDDHALVPTLFAAFTRQK